MAIIATRLGNIFMLLVKERNSGDSNLFRRVKSPADSEQLQYKNKPSSLASTHGY